MPSYRLRLRALVLATFALAATGFATTAPGQEPLIRKMDRATAEAFAMEFVDFQNVYTPGVYSVGFDYRQFKVQLNLHQSLTSLTLVTRFPDAAPLADLNAWNRESRYAKAYRTEDGMTVLEHDVDMAGGVTKEHLHEWVKTYVVQLELFAERIAAPKK